MTAFYFRCYRSVYVEAKMSIFCFFFSSSRRHTRWTGDWSSDVCSSDLEQGPVLRNRGQRGSDEAGGVFGADDQHAEDPDRDLREEQAAQALHRGVERQPLPDV